MQNLLLSTLLTTVASLTLLQPAVQAEPPDPPLQPMQPTNRYIFEDMGGSLHPQPTLNEEVFGGEDGFSFPELTVPDFYSVLSIIKNESADDIFACFQTTSSVTNRCYDATGNHRVVINPAYSQLWQSHSFYGDQLVNYQLELSENTGLNLRSHPSESGSSTILEVNVGID